MVLKFLKKRDCQALNKGFTLLEILLVLLIIGVLITSFAFLEVNQMLASLRLNAAARQLMAEIRELQQISLSEGSIEYAFSLKFYDSLDIYYLQEAAAPVPRIINRVNLPETVDLVNAGFSGKPNLFFSRTGAPQPGGGMVTLRDTVSGRFVYVIVAAVTGRVRVSDIPPNPSNFSFIDF